MFKKAIFSCWWEICIYAIGFSGHNIVATLGFLKEILSMSYVTCGCVDARKSSWRWNEIYLISVTFTGWRENIEREKGRFSPFILISFYKATYCTVWVVPLRGNEGWLKDILWRTRWVDCKSSGWLDLFKETFDYFKRFGYLKLATNSRTLSNYRCRPRCKQSSKEISKKRTNFSVNKF